MRGTLLVLAALLSGVASEADTVSLEHVHQKLIASENLRIGDVMRHMSSRAGTHKLVAARRAEVEAMARDADLTLTTAPSLSVRYTGDAPGEDRGLKEFETLLSMQFKWPGQRSAQRRLALVAAKFAASDSTATLWRLAGATREILWEHRTASDEVNAAYDALTLAEAIAATVALRYTHGDLARSDILLAESERLARARDLTAARVTLREVERRYLALTGLTDVPSVIEELINKANAVDTHPLLLATRIQVARAREEVSVQYYAGRAAPSITVGPRWERGSAREAYSESLGVELSVPFGSQRYTALDVTRAERRVTEALVAQQQLQRELELAIHEAEHELSAAEERRENIAAWQVLASERETIARLAFDAGDISLTDFLRVRLEAGMAKRAALLARNQIGQAIARYNQAAGVIPSTNMEAPPK